MLEVRFLMTLLTRRHRKLVPFPAGPGWPRLALTGPGWPNTSYLVWDLLKIYGLYPRFNAKIIMSELG